MYTGTSRRGRSVHDKARQLASACDYGNLTDDMMHDRLILATKDSAARARMFRESDLTLARAIDMCSIAEISQHQLQQIDSKQEEVNFTKQHKQQSHKTAKTVSTAISAQEMQILWAEPYI